MLFVPGDFGAANAAAKTGCRFFPIFFSPGFAPEFFVPLELSRLKIPRRQSPGRVDQFHDIGRAMIFHPLDLRAHPQHPIGDPDHLLKHVRIMNCHGAGPPNREAFQIFRSHHRSGAATSGSSKITKNSGNRRMPFSSLTNDRGFKICAIF